MQANTIEKNIFINQTTTKIWQALTTPEQLTKWWAAGNIQATPGHVFTLDMGNWGQQTCEVQTVKPETIFSYLFAKGLLNTTITWRLEKEANGTRLFLKQHGFDVQSPQGKMAFEGMGAGWPSILEKLASVAEAS